MNVNIKEIRDIDPGERILMGPGPSGVSPRVLQAMSAPCIGYLDPYFFRVMDETQALLKAVFQTENDLTIPLSATGTAGMEASFVNVIEPGDEVVVCVTGFFGARMCEMVERMGGKLIRVDGEWGRAMDPDLARKAVQGRSPKVLAVVHAETSTGVCQPLQDLAGIAHQCGALFLVDTVTSLGGLDIGLDKIGIDIAYSASQKCLSCPPGLAPVSFNAKAIKAIENRKNPVPNWYLDMSLLKKYWGAERKYHHTVPINMIYAFREALRIVMEEGIETRFARHRLNHRALVAGVEAMGLSMLVPETERLPSLNTIRIPDGADDLRVRKTLLNDFSLEIGGGLGKFAGKAWRVGLMGHSSSRKNVVLFLSALTSILKAQGVNVKPGAVEAASAIYAGA